VAECAQRIAEQKSRIALLRANGEDATCAAKILDELKVAHRLLVEQLVFEQARSGSYSDDREPS
jgi:hypothetical protein